MGIQDAIKQARLTSGGLSSIHGNDPSEYAGRQKQYYDTETKRFIQKKARLSSDFFEAQVQGVDPEDFTAWGTYRLRLADIIRPTAAILRNFDDYKQLLFEDPQVQYIRPGGKIVTMGSTWLVTNPQNISGGIGGGIVRRCNAVWNYLDYFGNVQREPMVIEELRANASDPDQQNSILVTKGYFNAIMQYNAFSGQLNTNSRVILGKGAYRITGFPPLLREFTDDPQSARLLSFTLRYEEPNAALDDLDNSVAESRSFSWSISVSGPSLLRTGTEAQFTASSLRCGVPAEGESYLWESGDESVLTVDSEGTCTAVSEGETVLLCSLEQNPEIFTEYPVSVSAENGLRWAETPPGLLQVGEACTLRAVWLDGAEADASVTYDFAGPERGCYAATVSGGSAQITCYGGSETPLTVTAWHGEERISTEIILEGF